MALYQWKNVQHSSNIEYNMAPLKQDSSLIHNAQEVVQLMWDEVRLTHSTDMQPLIFKNMNNEQSFLWANALQVFVCFKNIKAFR